MVEVILTIISCCILVFGTLILISSIFYFKFDFMKCFYHDCLGWHIPKEKEETVFDGCSIYAHCKHCGKEIMQDSQGNWF